MLFLVCLKLQGKGFNGTPQLQHKKKALTQLKS